MSDEQEGPSSDRQRSRAISNEGEKKAKRKPRRPAELKSPGLPCTQAGDKVADHFRQKLIEMVDAAALTEANRRRATALDATDYEAGFDRIAGPSRRENVVIIVADSAGAVGTGLIGYAINVYTGLRRTIPKGIWR